MKVLVHFLLLFLTCTTLIACDNKVDALPELPPELKAIADQQLATLPSYTLSSRQIKELELRQHFEQSNLNLIWINGGRVSTKGQVEILPDGRYYYKNHHINVMMSKLHELTQKYNLPNTAILFYLYDGVTPQLGKYDLKPYEPEINNIPIFTYAVDSESENIDNCILVPDIYTVASSRSSEYLKGWKKISQNVKAASQKTPWQKKEKKAFWIGSLTDNWNNTLMWFGRNALSWNRSLSGRSHRETLVEVIAPENEKIEAYFATSKTAPDWPSEKSQHKFVSQSDQIAYKYLINMDGATATYPGFLWRLYSNSVVLKQDSTHVQWFYPLFKPYEHYVPVKRDLSDLPQQIAWLEANDQKAKEIAENATRQVEKYVTPELVDAYFVYLIREYAKKVKVVG